MRAYTLRLLLLAGTNFSGLVVWLHLAPSDDEEEEEEDSSDGSDAEDSENTFLLILHFCF